MSIYTDTLIIASSLHCCSTRDSYTSYKQLNLNSYSSDFYNKLIMANRNMHYEEEALMKNDGNELCESIIIYNSIHLLYGS